MTAEKLLPVRSRYAQHRRIDSLSQRDVACSCYAEISRFRLWYVQNSIGWVKDEHRHCGHDGGVKGVKWTVQGGDASQWTRTSNDLAMTLQFTEPMSMAGPQEPDQPPTLGELRSSQFTSTVPLAKISSLGDEKEVPWLEQSNSPPWHSRASTRATIIFHRFGQSNRYLRQFIIRC